MIITGPAGSGKTLMIIEGLKMKVAECKQRGIPCKIIFAACSAAGCSQLHQEMRHKYGLDYLSNEFHVVPKSIGDLFRGKQSS